MSSSLLYYKRLANKPCQVSQQRDFTLLTVKSCQAQQELLHQMEHLDAVQSTEQGKIRDCPPAPFDHQLCTLLSLSFLTGKVCCWMRSIDSLETLVILNYDYVFT